MGREPLLKRVLLSAAFVFQYLYCFFFLDIPRLITLKRKCIADQVVIITGGAMGVGRGLARTFAIREHAIVCILDINEKDGIQTVTEINNEGGKALFYKCNVSKSDELRSCAEKIYSETKRDCVDIVVCNAAVLRMGEILEMSNDDFRITTDVNILGYIFTIRAFLPRMIERNKGHMVAIGSICSHFGECLGSAYCMSKFAIRGFMECLQMEMAEKKKDGITVTTIFPYFIDTTLVTDNLTEPFSTFFDVIPLSECVERMTDAILKDRLTYFIPWSLGFLCNNLKSLTTKCITPYSRRFFNFKYSIKKKNETRECSILLENE